MTDSKRASGTERALGDSAVDGLLAGVGAGIVMALYLWIAGLVQGDSTAAVFSRFDPAQPASPLTGALIHLAVSGVYGALYNVGRRITLGWPVLGRAPGWLLGMAFGLILLAVALGVILPGTGAAMRGVPPLHLTVAHLAYGFTLGVLADRWRA